MVLFSSLFSFFALPLIYIVEPEVFNIGYIKVLALIGSGGLTIISLILYFYALGRDEASTVVPFYQTIPIFSFILGYLVLGETISPLEIFACILIISGAVILSLDLGGNKIRIKYKVALLMIGASLSFAIDGVIFKLIALNEGFWVSAFWEFSGKFFIGIVIYIFIRSYREQFWKILKNNKFSVIALNSLNESLYILADGIMYFATLLAPLVLVATVGSLQPFMVFIMGIFITRFFPGLGKETISKNVLAQKIMAIGIIIIGAYILGFTDAP